MLLKTYEQSCVRNAQITDEIVVAVLGLNSFGFKIFLLVFILVYTFYRNVIIVLICFNIVTHVYSSKL